MSEYKDDDVELGGLHHANMEEQEDDDNPASARLNDHTLEDGNRNATENSFGDPNNRLLDTLVKRKLDLLLLPFLAILFLLNSMDKSNIGNAETAGFTRDAGLAPNDLNISMGCFFAFFVALQPVGAAMGRKFGMTRWVPACMSLWGLCTLLHVWVRRKWQLILLRIAVGCLEAGFYPTTVAYLSLFYTRYEFAVRLSFFYGQIAVAGLMGGILSWAVFSEYENRPDQNTEGGWKGWQVLFLIEGCLTMFVAAAGFFWLPRSGDTAWFLNPQEKLWAEKRIRLDYDNARTFNPPPGNSPTPTSDTEERTRLSSSSDRDNNEDDGEAYHRLLPEADSDTCPSAAFTGAPITADAGLSKQDILSAVFNYKIWHILACNILSAIPATAFGVFLPMVIQQLSPSDDLASSASNLLAAPPFAFGAVMLFLFARWSDRRKQRLVPIFYGLGLLILGLTVTILVPLGSYIVRYISLCILLSGSFIASPLTVAWITNNTPEPGKRSILLGINGWGNLAGVFLAVLFTREDQENGYIRPFIITLLCALASLVGYVAFWAILRRENKRRMEIVRGWSEGDKEREERSGDGPVPSSPYSQLQRRLGLDAIARRVGLEENRKGDEKMTFQYGL